jgi:pimeloyl-ACP methyl ester carboxylesterase
VVSEPPVALVHGFASSFDHGWARHGWPEMLADAGRTVVTVELLGHGNSDRPHDPAAYAAVAQHLLAQIPEGPVDAVGFSAGATALLSLAVAHPTRFRRLVLMGIGDGLFEPAGPTSVLAAVEGDSAPPLDELSGRVFRRLADANDNDRLALVAFLRGFGVQIQEASLRELLSPTLLVIGDRDPAFPCTRLRDALPNGELVVLLGLDHFSTTSDFRAIDAALTFVAG